MFKNYFIRLFLFAVILITIIGVSNYFIKPFIHGLMPNLAARITVTLITLLLMSPFLKALIGWETVIPMVIRNKFVGLISKISRSKEKTEGKKESLIEKLGICKLYDKEQAEKNFFVSNHDAAAIYYKLWTAKKINRLPLMLMTSFRLVAVLFIISTVVHQFLTENTKVTWALVIISIILLTQSRWLFEQYMKIEKQFLNNLNGENNTSGKPESEEIKNKA